MNSRSKLWKLLLLILMCSFRWTAQAAEKEYLDPNLEALRPLLGKTWKAELKNSTPAKPVIDIQRWERALNGKAVRILHSVNDGAYGGESIILWDATKHSVVFYYFTTASFMTTGTMTMSQGKMQTHEKVSGNEEGITEVRGTTEIKPDGTFHVTTEYLKNGEWGPGRDVTYREAPSAQVQFK